VNTVFAVQKTVALAYVSFHQLRTYRRIGSRPSRATTGLMQCNKVNACDPSLDHIVGNQQEIATNRQSEFPRSLQIDDYLECGGLLHGQLPRLRPL
jgi:hypothetical protein